MDDYASAHFKWSELECKCGCGTRNISPRAIFALEQLREVLAKPLTIVSGARCPKHNAEVGGAPHSHHISTPEHQSDAFDILVTPILNQADLIVQAKRVGFRGVGRGKSFTHVDMRSEPAEWAYDSHGHPIPIKE